MCVICPTPETTHPPNCVILHIFFGFFLNPSLTNFEILCSIHVPSEMWHKQTIETNPTQTLPQIKYQQCEWHKDHETCRMKILPHPENKQVPLNEFKRKNVT